jgi:hypothetical protein
LRAPASGAGGVHSRGHLADEAVYLGGDLVDLTLLIITAIFKIKLIKSGPLNLR